MVVDGVWWSVMTKGQANLRTRFSVQQMKFLKHPKHLPSRLQYVRCDYGAHTEYASSAVE
jgi:hypothetical protein